MRRFRKFHCSKNSSQCDGHVCLTTVKLHNYIKCNILIPSWGIIHYGIHQRVTDSTVDLYWSNADYIHTYISVEVITDWKAVYISHNFVSSILIESIPLYRDITYYRNFTSFTCESGIHVLTILCIHSISLIQPALLRKMNSRDKSCACIDFTSSIGVLMTLSSAIK